MASSNTEIANMATSNLGIGTAIADLLTENSEEANAIRAFYNPALKATLRDFDWIFARKRADLTLIEADPNDEWGFSYRYPDDALCLRRIPSGARNDSRQSRIEFTEGYDSTYGTIIYTDVEDAEMIYTVFHENPLYYPPDFELAFSFRLSYLACPRLCGNESKKLKADMWSAYQAELGRARANIGNEEQPPEPVEAECIRARDS